MLKMTCWLVRGSGPGKGMRQGYSAGRITGEVTSVIVLGALCVVWMR